MTSPKEELLQLLKESAPLEGLSPEEITGVAEVINGEDAITLAPELETEGAPESLPAAVPELPQKNASLPAKGNPNREIESVKGAEKEAIQDPRLQISKASLPEKIKLAMFGNATCRAVLIRDSNKLVQQFVLKNPRIQLLEIEEFSKNPNLSDLVMRIIANNPAWSKSYHVKAHLVFNPKTPVDIALKWVKFLNSPDVRKLSKTKNVSQVIVTAARKRVEEMAASRGGGG